MLPDNLRWKGGYLVALKRKFNLHVKHSLQNNIQLISTVDNYWICRRTPKIRFSCLCIQMACKQKYNACYRSLLAIDARMGVHLGSSICLQGIISAIVERAMVLSHSKDIRTYFKSKRHKTVTALLNPCF